jgi:hypothetical protein
VSDPVIVQLETGASVAVSISQPAAVQVLIPVGSKGQAAEGDLAFGASGLLGDGELLQVLNVGQDATYDPSLCIATVEDAPLSQKVLRITKNGSTWFTSTINGGQTSGTNAFSGPATVARGDKLRFYAPTPADPQMSHPAITLVQA